MPYPSLSIIKLEQHLMKKIVLHSLFLSLAFSSISAFAGSATTNVAGAADVQATCSVAVGNINFGQISTASSTNASTSITAICTKDTSYTLSVNIGNSSSFNNRIMTGSTSGNVDGLNYNIYNSNQYNSIVGDGTGSTVVYTGTGSGLSQSYSLYGSIPGNQYVTPDNYTDNLTVTLNY
jgi:spore coat protein U-like protein